MTTTPQRPRTTIDTHTTEARYQLLGWGPAEGLPSVDPACLSVQTWLRIKGVEFSVNNCNNPRVSPNGKLPVLFDNDNVYAGAWQIFESPSLFSTSEETTATPTPPAEAGFRSLVEDSLNDCLLYCLWIDSDNVEYAHRVYNSLIPLASRYFVMNDLLAHAKQKLALHEEEASPLTDYSKKIYLSAREGYEALSARLGGSQFFGGDEPSMLDAIVFGHLAIHYRLKMPNNKLRVIIAAFPNLVAHIDRMFDLYFPSSYKPIEHFGSPLKSPAHLTPRKSSLATPTPKDERLTKHEQEYRNRLRWNRILSVVIGVSVVALFGFRQIIMEFRSRR